jgi:hypothetical protein
LGKRKVEEVQAFSIVDDKNYVDVTEKLNLILSSCVRFYHPDKNKGSYKDVKDGDRLYLIFQIRELTFQSGAALSKEVQCEECTKEFNVIYRTTSNPSHPKTLYPAEFPESLRKYWQKDEHCFKFEIDGATYKLAPPTIGIQESFFTDIRKKVEIDQKRNPNVSQMKLLQFMLWDRNSITEEGIKKWEDEIKNLDMRTFQILNAAVDKMEFGLTEIKQECHSCGAEVRSEITFPDGPSSLFIISNPFDEFDRQ